MIADKIIEMYEFCPNCNNYGYYLDVNDNRITCTECNQPRIKKLIDKATANMPVIPDGEFVEVIRKGRYEIRLTGEHITLVDLYDEHREMASVTIACGIDERALALADTFLAFVELNGE